MLNTIAYIFGSLFLIAGVLGFIPAATPGGLLLGLFSVNLAHNIIHLLTGVALLLAPSFGWTRLFFQVFGVIYLLVALMGFFHGNEPVLGLVANNFADTIFHLVVGAFSLFVGFCKECVK